MTSLPLFLHLLSFAILAAGLIAGIITHRAVLSAVHDKPQQVPALGALAARFGIAAQLGALLMPLTGVYLLWSHGWAERGQLWLTIKIVLYVLLLANGILVARPAGARLTALFAQGPAADAGSIHRLLARFTIFYRVQLGGLIAIVALVVFKPFT